MRIEWDQAVWRTGPNETVTYWIENERHPESWLRCRWLDVPVSDLPLVSSDDEKQLGNFVTRIVVGGDGLSLICQLRGMSQPWPGIRTITDDIEPDVEHYLEQLTSP